MNSEQAELINDLVGDEALAAKQHLHSHLLQTVNRARQWRSVRRASLAMVASFFIFLGFLSMSEDESVRMPISFSDTAMPDQSSERFVVISNNPHVDYIRNEPQIEYLPTRQLAMNLINDQELEATFAERAYALVQNENDQITAFHLLDLDRVVE